MPSQFFGLNISYSALVSANAALNTTANNIANEETKGYSKQVVVTQASEALRTFTSYGCAGAGVDTLAIERLRNQYYDVRFWNNNSNLGEYNIKRDYAEILQNYFKDDEYTTGFNTIFGNLFSGLEEVKKHSGDSTYRQAFLTQAAMLTSYFNAMYANLQNVQKDLNSELKTTVDQINNYASQIASLNKQINVIELSGSAANELRDQRGYLIDCLSELVSVETKETPVYDANDPTRETGAHRFTVKIAGGDMLVSGMEYNTLEYIARSNTEKVNQSDINGLYDLFWSNGNRFNLNNASIGGNLKGIIDMRDGNNNEYFHGMITDINMKNVGGVVRQSVKVEVDASYLKDINKSNLAEHGKIRLYDQELCYDSFTYEYDTNTGKCSYTFELSDSKRNKDPLTGNKNGKDATIGVANAYQGIPYYMQQMSEWLRDFSRAFNEILTQPGAVDGNENPAEGIENGLFVASPKAGGEQIFCESYLTNGVYRLSSSDNSYYKITGGTVDISEAIAKDPSLLATHTIQTDGNDKYDILDALVDLQTNKDRMTFRGCSSSEFLQCILADVALNAQNAITFQDKYEDFGTNLDNLRMSVSGVDKDEEGVDLVKYQNAFTLASKMVNCFTEIYDRLILQTGV